MNDPPKGELIEEKSIYFPNLFIDGGPGKKTGRLL